MLNSSTAQDTYILNQPNTILGNDIYNFSIGYQNIEGQHNSILGCKLQNYVELINDIEILSETWSNCKSCRETEVDGYTRLVNIEPRKIGTRKGRNSGGIQIFCKSYVKPFLHIVKKNDFYVWLEIDKNLFRNCLKNIVLCVFYSPPRASQYFCDQIWDDVNN